MTKLLNKPTVALLAIGNELISGKITDTNSSFIARELNELGFQVTRILAVGDDLNRIKAALSELCAEAELVFTTGGLGPTSDDLTREAVSTFSNSVLKENSAAKSKLEALFAKRQRPLHATNYRQVQFPETAQVVNNRSGTADAFITPVKSLNRSSSVVSLPGIPSEMKCIFREEILDWLKANFGPRLESPSSISFKCFGVSEAFLGQQIESCGLAKELEVAYRPMFPEILLSVTHLGEGSSANKAAALALARTDILAAIGSDHVFSEDPYATLPETVGKLLDDQKLSLALGESCSGGLLADSLVSIPGSSRFLLSSLVTYSNDSKSTFLGVRPALIERWGAVSQEVAIEMARGARFRSGAHFGMSISGIAGPDGGTDEKPVGTFFIGLAADGIETALKFFYPQERNMLRRYTVHVALEILRRHLLNLDINWQRK